MARKKPTQRLTPADFQHQHSQKAAIRSIRADAWRNAFTGAGIIGKDKLESSTFEIRTKRDDKTVAALYRQNWLGRRLVDDLADDATRAGFTLELGKDAIEDTETLMENEWTRIALLDRCRLGMTWSSVFGGAVGLLYTDDIPATTMGAATVLETPLDLNNIKSLKRILIVDRRWAQPQLTQFTEDPDSINFGLPEMYQVTPYGQTNGVSYMVHWSRLVRFDGAQTDAVAKLDNMTWDDSIYEIAWDPLMRYGMTFAGAAVAAGNFGAQKMKVKDLATLLDTREDKSENGLVARMYAIKMTLSAFGIAVIDADGEDLEFMGQTLTGLNDILTLFKQEVAGMSHEPQSKLYGNQAGKVAGAEQDSEVWAQYVHSEQRRRVFKPMEYITQILFACKEGPFKGIVPTWKLKANPIDAPSLDQQLQQRKVQSEIYHTAYADGVLEPSEIREAQYGGQSYSHEIVLDPAITTMIKEREKAAAAAPAPEPEPDKVPA